jgi:hypothetical protein
VGKPEGKRPLGKRRLRREYNIKIHSSKESYSLCKKNYETEEEARAQQRAAEPLLNE